MFFRIAISLILVTSLFAGGTALAGAKVYVSGHDETIRVYDQQTGVEEAVITVNGNNPDNLFVHPSGDYLFTTTYTGSNLGYKIVKIDTAQNIPVEEVALTTSGPHVWKVTYSPMGDKVYFFQQPLRYGPTSPVYAFNLNTMTLDSETPMDFDVQSMTISPDGGQLFIMGTNGTLRVIDTATLQMVMEVNLGAGTDIRAMHPSGETLYVNHQNNFHPVSTTTLELLPSIGAADHLQAVVSEEYIFIDRNLTIDVINIDDYSLLGTIDVMAQFTWPWATTMAFDSSTKKLSAVGMNYLTIESDLVIFDIPSLTIENIIPTTRFPINVATKPDTVNLTLQVQGMDATTVQCSNNTTGQVIQITTQPTENAWNCEAHGLLVQSGDEVDINVIGTAQ